VLLLTTPIRDGGDSDFFQPRVGGGALSRWPPSAAQTVHPVFPHTAFTKIPASGVRLKELGQRG
jgi:hypothetical protein